MTRTELRKLRDDCDTLVSVTTRRIAAGHMTSDLTGALAQIATLGLICEQLCEVLLDGVDDG